MTTRDEANAIFYASVHLLYIKLLLFLPSFGSYNANALASGASLTFLFMHKRPLYFLPSILFSYGEAGLNFCFPRLVCF